MLASSCASSAHLGAILGHVGAKMADKSGKMAIKSAKMSQDRRQEEPRNVHRSVTGQGPAAEAEAPKLDFIDLRLI